MLMIQSRGVKNNSGERERVYAECLSFFGPQKSAHCQNKGRGRI